MEGGSHHLGMEGRTLEQTQMGASRCLDSSAREGTGTMTAGPPNISGRSKGPAYKHIRTLRGGRKGLGGHQTLQFVRKTALSFSTLLTQANRGQRPTAHKRLRPGGADLLLPGLGFASTG